MNIRNNVLTRLIERVSEKSSLPFRATILSLENLANQIKKEKIINHRKLDDKKNYLIVNRDLNGESIVRHLSKKYRQVLT